MADSLQFLRSTWHPNAGGIPFASMFVDVPHIILCVDCGGVCHRLTPEPEDGFAPGAIVAFRCEDCLDRWDLEFDPEEG